jgi:hypothetical protein
MACSLPADWVYSRITGMNSFTMVGDMPKSEKALVTPARSPRPPDEPPSSELADPSARRSSRLRGGAHEARDFGQGARRRYRSRPHGHLFLMHSGLFESTLNLVLQHQEFGRSLSKLVIDTSCNLLAARRQGPPFLSAAMGRG